ncbi:MAG: RluA family pseudouridine synthase [Patescibacteria group bacterium]
MKNSNTHPDKSSLKKNEFKNQNPAVIKVIADYSDRLDLVLSESHLDTNPDKQFPISRTLGSKTLGSRTLGSRTRFKKLIKDGFVKVNSNIVKKPRFEVNPGDEITYIDFSYKPDFNIKPQNIKLDIIYEDQNVIVINKKQGQVVHPGAGNLDKTILNGIIFKLRFNESRFDRSRSDNNDSNLSQRPGVVHRLDKDTTGVMLFAKDEDTLNFLVEQFKKREVEKTYLVLANGFISSSVKGGTYIDKSNFTVKGFIKRSNTDRRKFVFSDTESGSGSGSGGKESITNFKILKYIGTQYIENNGPRSKVSRNRGVEERFTLLEAYPKTGRTHQIRVALASCGHPVVGDKVYAIKSFRQPSSLNNMYLHSLSLKLKIPSADGSGELRTFVADVPSFWSKTLGTRFIGSKPLGK